VSLRVIPFTAGLHHGTMVYLDGFTADLYLDKSHEVDRYDTAFRNNGESSLDEKASREPITQVARELGK
jgi:hypothetical protein